MRYTLGMSKYTKTVELPRTADGLIKLYCRACSESFGEQPSVVKAAAGNNYTCPNCNTEAALRDFYPQEIYTALREFGRDVVKESIRKLKGRIK